MVKPDLKMPSWRDITSTFAADSTIHGVNKMGARNLYPGRRILWLLLVLMAVSTLSALLYLELVHYYDRPTLIKEIFRSAKQEDFPAVTICPLKAFQGDVKDLDIPPYGSDMLHEIMHVDSYLAASALTHIHMKLQDHLFTNISSWYSDPISGEAMANWTMSSKVLTPIACPKFKGMHIMALPCCEEILERVLTEIGSCYTINMTKVFKYRHQSAKNRRLVIAFSLKLEPNLKIFSANGIQVIVHDRREAPLPTMRGDFVALNTVTTFRVEMSQRQSLSEPYQSFGTAQCVDARSPEFRNPISRYGHDDSFYTIQTCEMECFVNYTINACGCRHPWHRGTEELCSIMDIYNCFVNIKDNYVIDNDTNCICPHVCSKTTFTSTVTTNTMKVPNFNLPHHSPEQDLSEIECLKEEEPEMVPPESIVILDILLPKTVRELEQIPSKRLLDILSSFGGLLGLFLGLSLLSLCEVIEFIFLLIGSLARKVDKQEEQKVDG